MESGRASAAPASTTGGFFFSLYPDLDNIGGSPHPRTDGNGLGRAVVYAGAAFHAGVEIYNTGSALPHFKHCLGADFGAKPASHTFVRVQHQSGHIIQIS
jgi:hypothetical protein